MMSTSTDVHDPKVDTRQMLPSPETDPSEVAAATAVLLGATGKLEAKLGTLAMMA